VGNTIRLHLPANYDRSLLPVPAERRRAWFEDNARTREHARHCLPLIMANSLGYYILSPGRFLVSWDGSPHSPALVQVLEASSHCVVDNHAAFGSFTVQASFIPQTDDPGDFLMIKGIPNDRDARFSCMEAVIEAWSLVGNFGLVFLLHGAGTVEVQRGQPIAQMFLLKGGSARLEAVDGMPAGHQEWQARRHRPGYTKDLDYFRGRHPNGQPMEGHVTNWKDS